MLPLAPAASKRWQRECAGGIADWRQTAGRLSRSPTPNPLHSSQMPALRQDLFDLLAGLGIEATTLEHPPVFTVAESAELERQLSGAHTKNLFLKDEDGLLFLVVAMSSTRVDLKGLARTLGAGRFSFGKPELLLEALGVPPGSVTAFAVINDTARRVNLVMDAELMQHETINCHPLENTATTSIGRDDLLRFFRSCGHEPRIVTLGPAAPTRP
jgi:Ala-tRNA(Pro) deacylase